MFAVESCGCDQHVMGADGLPLLFESGPEPGMFPRDRCIKLDDGDLSQDIFNKPATSESTISRISPFNSVQQF
jgi:hypothetical protein